MKHYDVAPLIHEVCANAALDFRQKGQIITQKVLALSDDDLLEHLDNAGVIPESLDHDSTEEKVFAKYCDSLLARSFRAIGLQADAIDERADAADVVAKADEYTLVADAKAFRLSRTAKNQKDFKVEALNTWRKGANYACLVGPLYQYPTRTSQIYGQATRYNVTLISYAHLSYLVKAYKTTGKFAKSLKALWEVGSNLTTSNDAVIYWAAIDNAISDIVGQPSEELAAALEYSITHLPAQADEQISYLESEKLKVSKMTHQEAVQALIKAMKIDAKIEIIKKHKKELQ